MIQIKEAEVRDLIAVRGDGNFIANISSVLKADKSPLDFVTDLPELGDDQYAGAELLADARSYALTLRTQRFVVLGCSNPDLARSAGSALISASGVPRQHWKLLNAERVTSDTTFDIYQLTKRRVDPDAETAIILDTMNARGKDFIDSLPSVRGAWSTLDIANDLRRHGLLVVCLAYPQHLSSLAEAFPFRRWNVSHVMHLLQPKFPASYRELDAKIAEQRKRKCWPSDEREFSDQIDELLSSGRLEEVVDQGGPLASAIDSVAIADDAPLELAVLYTATFYPRLAPNEFSRVLATLVGDSKTVVPETIQHKVKDGFKSVHLHRERQLIDLWRERSDRVLRECRLVTSSDDGRVIAFPEMGRRDRLRRSFEQNYGVYTHNQFITAWENGLLFDASDSIVHGVIDLALDAAVAYPDQFEREWLFETLERALDRATARSRVLRRFAELLREMLREPRLGGHVPRLIDRLLHAGRHAEALELVKNLRFAQLELEWLKQIIDRGSSEVRADAARYIELELHRRGAVYPLLQALETWLPAKDRDRTSYSPSNEAALRIAFRYVYGATEAFETEHYGIWPSRLPLFAMERQTAARNFQCLFHFLLHPGMPDIIAAEGESDPSRLVFVLIVQWTFILLGPGKATGTASTSADLTADDVLTLLVEQLVRATNTVENDAFREAMPAYWERLRIAFTAGPVALGEEGIRRRHEFAWKRTATTSLLTRFRQAQRQLRPVLKQRLAHA